MTNQNEDLSPKEKLDQENFVLKSKIITKGGIYQENADIDPEIENIFLKRIDSSLSGDIPEISACNNSFMSSGKISGVRCNIFCNSDLLDVCCNMFYYIYKLR